MSNDLWRTPPEVFNGLNKEFNFMADMASSHENALCTLHFTEDQDSLSFNWADEACLQSNRTRYVWLNCPYSNPMPWIKKAAEAQRNGLGVVMLLNMDVSVGWFAEALKSVSEIRCVIGDPTETHRKYKSGRINFLDGEGKPGMANNKPQCILVFNPFKIGNPVTTYITKDTIMGVKQ